jgi:hypothetical protein
LIPNARRSIPGGREPVLLALSFWLKASRTGVEGRIEAKLVEVVVATRRERVKRLYGNMIVRVAVEKEASPGHVVRRFDMGR